MWTYQNGYKLMTVVLPLVPIRSKLCAKLVILYKYNVAFLSLSFAPFLANQSGWRNK